MEDLTKAAAIPTLLSCFNFTTVPHNKRPFSKVGNISDVLIMDFYRIDQNFLNIILESYPRPRDIHTNPPQYAPFYVLVILLASEINATVVMKSNLNKHCMDPGGNPIFPTVFPTELGSNLVKYFDKNLTKPRVVVGNLVACNFGYCATTTKLAQDMSPFGLFQSTADHFVWLSLITAITLMSFLFYVRTGWTSSFSETFLVSVSALLCPGIYVSSKLLQNFWLFTLWTCVSLIFITYYSGSWTSIVISPAPEWSIASIGELIKQNFSIVIVTSSSLALIRDLVRLSVPMGGNQEKIREVETVQRLLQKALVPPTKAKFVEILATQDKVATLTTWSNTIFSATRASSLISRRKIRNKRCYIGKKLEYHKSLYFIFTPPRSDQLAGIFAKFVEAGIYQFWWQEMISISSSDRVQGRSRVVSPTHILIDKEGPKSLDLEGKLANVFFLWVVCVAFCILSFLMEGVFSYFCATNFLFT